MTKGRRPFIAAMSGSLLGCLIFVSVLAVADVSHAAKDPRHVPLDGQTNFRDLGGYETIDGRVVKWGEIYRSGELPRLSDKDLDRIESLGLRTVVNFLTPEETEARGKDRLPDGIREIAAPLSGGVDNDLAQVVLEARKTGDFSSVPPEFNADIHRILIKEATAEYAALLRAARLRRRIRRIAPWSSIAHMAFTARVRQQQSCSRLWAYRGRQYVKTTCSPTGIGLKKSTAVSKN